MQQEIKDGGAAALLQPKQEIIDPDYDMQLIPVKTEVIVKEEKELDQIKVEQTLTTSVFQKVKIEENNPKENCGNGINNEAGMDIVNELEVLINSETVPIVEVTQVEVNNCNLQQSQEIEENNDCDQNGEENVNLEQSEGNEKEEENDLLNQNEEGVFNVQEFQENKEDKTNYDLPQTQATKEVNNDNNLEQLEAENKVVDDNINVVKEATTEVAIKNTNNPDNQATKEINDDNNLEQLKSENKVVDDNINVVKKATTEVAIKNTNNSDSQTTKEVNDNSKQLKAENKQVNDNINVVKEATTEAPTKNTANNTEEDGKKLTKKEKNKLLQNLENQIIQNRINPDNLPSDMWKSLKQINETRIQQFLRRMKEKLLEREEIKIPVYEEDINDIVNNLSDWLLEKSEEMERNPNEITEKRSNVDNNTDKLLFTDAQRKRFMRNFERMIESNLLDINNLPPRITESLKQLKAKERKALRKKVMERSNTKPSTISDFNNKFNSLHSQNKNDRYTNQENYNSKNQPLYSFDRDYHKQQLYEQGPAANIATTSKASPDIFCQEGYSQGYSSNGNSYNNDFQILNNDFGRSLLNNTYFNDNQGFTYEGATHGRSNFNQYESYNDKCLNFQSYNNGYASSTTSTSTYSSRTQDKSLKRKLPSPHDQPQPKQLNMGNENDEAIIAIITDKGNPRGTMTDKQSSLLSAELLRLLDNVSLSAKNHIPRFYDSVLARGVFKINCADEKSLDWLKKMVPKLPQLWYGAKFSVTRLEKFSPNKIHARIFIPHSLGNTATVLLRLEKQNPELKTGAWKIWQRTRNDRGQFLYLEIDEYSLNVLAKMNFKAFLGLSCVYFKINNKVKKAMEEKQQQN